MSIGAKVKRYREAKGFSQDELALRLDIAQSTISSIESDKSIPNSLLLNKIAKELEVDINDLLNDKSNFFVSNNDFHDSSSIIHQYYPTIQMQSPELIESILKNQEQISKLIDVQSKLLESLTNKV